MELIGIPYRITLGKGVKDGKAELVKRSEGQKQEIEIAELEALLDKIYA